MIFVWLRRRGRRYPRVVESLKWGMPRTRGTPKLRSVYQVRMKPANAASDSTPPTKASSRGLKARNVLLLC